MRDMRNRELQLEKALQEEKERGKAHLDELSAAKEENEVLRRKLIGSPNKLEDKTNT